MAVTTNLPPQAYTRDTLVKAIDWINRQPPPMKERASSADVIVSLYLQACRRTDMPMETAASHETFREDLKHLAEDLKQFDEPFAPPPVEQVVRREPPVAPAARIFRPEPGPSASPRPSQLPPQMQQPKGFNWVVDARSLAMAREIQQRLNLSSEGDGLRVLITLGAERARELLP
jgi:hypothetical protein